MIKRNKSIYLVGRRDLGNGQLGEATWARLSQKNCGVNLEVGVKEEERWSSF